MIIKTIHQHNPLFHYNIVNNNLINSPFQKKMTTTIKMIIKYSLILILNQTCLKQTNNIKILIQQIIYIKNNKKNNRIRNYMIYNNNKESFMIRIQRVLLLVSNLKFKRNEDHIFQILQIIKLIIQHFLYKRN